MNPHIVPYEGWSKIPKQREILDIRIGSIIQITTSIQDISEGDIVLLGIPQDIGVERNGGRKGAAQAHGHEALGYGCAHGVLMECS